MRQEDMRKLATLIALLAILSLALPSAASAGRRWEAAEPTITPQHVIPCQDEHKLVGKFHGTDDSSPNYSRTAAGAVLRPYISECGDDDAGVSMWVGLQLRSEPIFATGAVIQGGILDCRQGFSIPSTICSEHPGQLRRFGGVGGCTNDYMWDMGSAVSGGEYNTRVEHDPDGFRVYVGGSVSFIDRNDQRAFCFYPSHLKAVYSGEKWDRGDSYGSQSVSNRSAMFQMGAQNTSNPNSWYSLNLPYGNCPHSASTFPHNSICYQGGNTLYLYD